MKKVLSLLVALIFTQVQTWALSGGPPLDSNNLSDLSGTYSGVLTGNTDNGDLFAQNAVGIFDLGVPTAQTAQGSMLIFMNGEFYEGGIVGIADPTQGILTAVAKAEHIIEEIGGSTTTGTQPTITYDSEADGAIKATFATDPVAGISFAGSAVFTVTDLNANFTAFVSAGTASFNVTGFLQTTTVDLPDADSIASSITSD